MWIPHKPNLLILHSMKSLADNTNGRYVASLQQKCETLEWELQEMHARYLKDVLQHGNCPMGYGTGAEVLEWLKNDPVTGPPPAHASWVSGGSNSEVRL